MHPIFVIAHRTLCICAIEVIDTLTSCRSTKDINAFLHSSRLISSHCQLFFFNPTSFALADVGCKKNIKQLFDATERCVVHAILKCVISVLTAHVLVRSLLQTHLLSHSTFPTKSYQGSVCMS